MAGSLPAAALMVYVAATAVAVWRLLFPGVGRPCPAPMPWLTSRTMGVGHVDVHVSTYLPDDERPVCVLQHGLGECGAALTAETALLRRLGFGIVLMDLPGHGRSSRHPTTYGVHEARLLREVLDRLAVSERATILWGRSVGAAMVLQVAPGLPGVTAVILDGMFDNPLRSIARHALERPRFRPLIPLLPGVMTAIYLFLAVRGSTRFPTAHVALPRVPLLFITGSHDVGMPPRVQRRLLARARHPESEMVEVPEAGHYGCFARMPSAFESWLVRHGAIRAGLGRPPASPRTA